MMPIVSIIIPTFNRAHFIGETLESILDQTYVNWECIVVDDRSTDYTIQLMEFYCSKDNRIKFYERPQNRPRGANACRNYGFEKSQGSFVNWFDSDDLMKEQNLSLKMRTFDEDTDMVIGNSLNFDDKGNFSRPYKLNYEAAVTAENFIGGVIGWITNDILIRRSAVKIAWNENLKSGQEYNFFSRLLYYTNRAKYLKKDVAKRRIHGTSIQQELKIKTIKKKNIELFENEIHLLKDIDKKASKNIIRRSLKRIVRFSYYSISKFTIDKNQFLTLKFLIKKKFMMASVYYLIWVLVNVLTGKGYFLISYTQENITKKKKYSKC